MAQVLYLQLHCRSFQYIILSQLFNSPLSPSSTGSLVPLHFLPVYVICISQLIDIFPGTLDSSLWFIQPGILDDVLSYGAFQVALVVKNPPASARDIRDMGLIPGSGRSSALGNGNPPHYYCLENPMGRGAWCATQSMGSQSQIQLKWLSTHSDSLCI